MTFLAQFSGQAPGGESGEFQWNSGGVFEGSPALLRVANDHVRLFDNYEFQIGDGGARIYTDGGTVYLDGVQGDSIHFNNASRDTDFRFDGDTDTHVLHMDAGRSCVGFGVSAPLSRVHIAAGSTSRAPFRLTPGTNVTSAVAGALEYDGTDLFFTPVSTRSTVSFINRAETFSGAKTFSTNVTITDCNVILSATTGTKFGTATTQKLSFWNKTPIAQPTTGIAEATFVENAGGTAVNVDSTFGGYTLQQVTQALQNIGFLA